MQKNSIIGDEKEECVDLSFPRIFYWKRVKTLKNTIYIDEDFITLGQLLKHVNVISSGGMAKWYLSEYFVYVNDEEEQRRGRKLREGDVIEFPHEEVKVFIKNRD